MQLNTTFPRTSFLILASAGFFLLSSSVHAQSDDVFPSATIAPASPILNQPWSEQLLVYGGLSRAKNLARQTAEKYNGGLQKYQTDYSMHGPVTSTHFNDQGTFWIFKFQGGTPGFTQPTIESEIQVDKDTFKTSVLYNGSIR